MKQYSIRGWNNYYIRKYTPQTTPTGEIFIKNGDYHIWQKDINTPCLTCPHFACYENFFQCGSPLYWHREFIEKPAFGGYTAEEALCQLYYNCPEDK